MTMKPETFQVVVMTLITRQIPTQKSEKKRKNQSVKIKSIKNQKNNQKICFS